MRDESLDRVEFTGQILRCTDITKLQSLYVESSETCLYFEFAYQASARWSLCLSYETPDEKNIAKDDLSSLQGSPNLT